jgi:type IV pilus assembly protein PilM
MVLKFIRDVSLMKKKVDLTVFISDFRCAYMTHQNQLDKSLSEEISLPEGVIVNGYIKEPDILYHLLLESIKQNAIKLRNVFILIHDQNLLIRSLKISKDELQKKSIDQYLHEQTDKKVYFPFEKAAISHYIQEQDDNRVKAIAMITDEDLLHDYYDVFEKLGAKEVEFDLPSLSLYEVYKDQFKSDSNQVMIVTVYHHLLAIQIYENNTPIFQMIEECDDAKSNTVLILENYIERIANYYKYNLKKGDVQIDEIVIYNLSDHLSKPMIEKELIPRLKDFKAFHFDFTKVDGYKENLPKGCYLPFLSIKSSRLKLQIPFDFELERIKRVNILGNYLMVFAFLIFSSVALLYIPFYLLNEDITNEENTIQSLENQLEILQRDQTNHDTYTDEQIQYNQAYEMLIEKEMNYRSHVIDLIIEIDENISLDHIDIDAQTKTITLLLSGHTQLDLDEYALRIYETYGLSSYDNSQSRWILEEPTVEFLSELLMEVTIIYA